MMDGGFVERFAVVPDREFLPIYSPHLYLWFFSKKVAEIR
jgi:hypothetical protein